MLGFQELPEIFHVAGEELVAMLHEQGDVGIDDVARASVPHEHTRGLIVSGRQADDLDAREDTRKECLLAAVAPYLSHHGCARANRNAPGLKNLEHRPNISIPFLDGDQCAGVKNSLHRRLRVPRRSNAFAAALSSSAVNGPSSACHWSSASRSASLRSRSAVASAIQAERLTFARFAAFRAAAPRAGSKVIESRSTCMHTMVLHTAVCVKRAKLEKIGSPDAFRGASRSATSASMRAWLLVLGLFLPATAAAQGIRLDYQVPRDVDCPDEEAFIDLIRARLAHAPFDDEAAPALSILVTATPLRAEIVWRDADGEVQGRRIIEGTSCPSLVETVAVASSVAIEEMEALAPHHEPAHVIVRVVERDPERPPALVSPPAPEIALPDPVFARLSVSAAIGVGPGPSPYADFSLGGGVRYRDLGVLLSIHYGDAFVGSLVGGGASLRMRLVRGRLAGCWMPPLLFYAQPRPWECWKVSRATCSMRAPDARSWAPGAR